MRPRLVVGDVLGGAAAGLVLDLPDGAVRHLQVLRMQPGDEVWVLDGLGAGWVAAVQEMGRKVASVALREPLVRDVELPVRVTLVVGVPANDRMDALVEKATELGAWRVQPLLCERAVWRADGARAEKKVAHWQGVAQAAAEQSGRMVVPVVAPVATFQGWAAAGGAAGTDGSQEMLVLDPRAERSLGEWLAARGYRDPAEGGGASQSASHSADQGQGQGPVPAPSLQVVSGPEGGLTEHEVAQLVKLGATPVRLGPRVLRADTAPLAMLAILGAALER